MTHVSGSPVKTLAEVQAAIGRCKEEGAHSWCALTFDDSLPPRAAPRATPATTPKSTAADAASEARLRSGGATVACWFALKFFAGSQAHEWLGTCLAFGLSAVVASSIGFDAAVFFCGVLCTVTLLRLLEMVFGSGVYDLVVLALIAAYHTKPAAKSFDGRPMKEMMAIKKEAKERRKAAAARQRPTPTGIDAFFKDVVSAGKQLVKDAVADVADATVPVKFRDFHVLVVAEAQFSHNREENVFYVGAFGRWFNLNSALMMSILDLDAKLRGMGSSQQRNSQRPT